MICPGFPDFAPPQHVTDALADVAKGDNVLIHQYTRGYVNITFLFFFKPVLVLYQIILQGPSTPDSSSFKTLQPAHW